jgi:hypothetical protein
LPAFKSAAACLLKASKSNFVSFSCLILRVKFI